MSDEYDPKEHELAGARSAVQTFLHRKQRLTTALFWIAGTAEGLFGLGMLYFMDWHDRFHWFLLCGFLMVYMPLVMMTWRNSVKMDHLYFRLVNELKYEE